MGRYALLIVFAMTFALIIYSQGMKNVYLSSQYLVVEKIHSIQAQNIAQSAALMKVKAIDDSNDKSNVANYTSWPEMGGDYKINVSEVGDTITINTFGKYRTTEYPVTVKMAISEQTWAPNLSHAVFAGSSIKMSGSSRIEGDVGTNATGSNLVELTGNPRITGALTVGPGGDPSDVVKAPTYTDITTFVHGGVSASSQEQVFDLPPFYEFPDHTNTLPPITLQYNSKKDYTASELGSYIPSINISGGWTLNIDTEGQDIVLHVGDFNISQGFINFTGGGKVTLLIENNFTFSGSSRLNDGGDVSDVMTYYKGTNELNIPGATKFNSNLYAESAEITLSGSGGLQGSIVTGGDKVTVSGAADALSRVVYAPNADVLITGSGSVKGSVVAKTFDASGAAEVIFESDSEYEIPDISLQNTKPVIVYWN